MGLQLRGHDLGTSRERDARARGERESENAPEKRRAVAPPRERARNLRELDQGSRPLVCGGLFH